MNSADITACERWFLRRGTPHLIGEYHATTDIFTRALPVLTLVFLASVAAAGNVEWSVVANAAAIAGGFIVLVGIWAFTNRLRDRPALQRPDTIGGVELAVFVLAPAGLQVVFGGQGKAAAGTLVAMLVLLAVIYVVTSYGLVPLTRWTLVESFRELGAVLGVVVRALPLLLLVNAFLFINAEMWQVAHGFNGAALTTTVALFVGLGTVFLLIRLPNEIDRLAASELAPALLGGTPAAAMEMGEPQPLSGQQRRNLLLVLLVGQAVQVIVVSVLIAAFFVVFGLVAIPPDVITAWIGASGDSLATLALFGRDVALTAELLKVATFLAAFSGLYFAVYVVTDSTYREEFFEELLDELRRALAVRCAYLRATRH